MQAWKAHDAHALSSIERSVGSHEPRCAAHAHRRKLQEPILSRQPDQSRFVRPPAVSHQQQDLLPPETAECYEEAMAPALSITTHALRLARKGLAHNYQGLQLSLHLRPAWLEMMEVFTCLTRTHSPQREVVSTNRIELISENKIYGCPM